MLLKYRNLYIREKFNLRYVFTLTEEMRFDEDVILCE